MSKPGYIVIVSPSYGGAEKRFFDIFTGMRRSARPVHFVAPSGLVARLQKDHPERGDIFDAMIPVPMPEWSRFGFIRAFRTLLQTLPRGSHFHYPLNCLWPLHLGRGDRMSMSVVDCTTVPRLFSKKQADVLHWVSFPFVRKIDVLSPAIFKASLRERLRARMHLTPGGTYLVPAAPTAVEKRPDVVFLGRLVPGKGVDDLLDVLPGLWELLKDRAVPGCSFKIAGYGALEQHVAARVRTLQEAGIPVEFIGYREAAPLLAESAVVLSLQEVTNFPSRVVPEAMLAGCAVLVRDTGDSREFGAGLQGLEYCQARLDAGELANRIAANLQSVLHDPQFRDGVRRAALARFSSGEYIDYFSGIIFGKPAVGSGARLD
jgi:glycosyltransferase involved in cell wall biosynthesis